MACYLVFLAGVAQRQSNRFVSDGSRVQVPPPAQMRSNPDITYITVYAGAGGDDAKDWASILADMYLRYSERKGWKGQRVDDNILKVRGKGSYERLKEENGVHRLVRISPFDSKKLRHTSFALVEALPEFSDGSDVKIPDNDLRIDFYRSSGPGGQNVNKVETAVRVTHLPTGLTASSQLERSQSANKQQAISILRSKLLSLMDKEKEKEIDKLKAKAKPEWGHEIRSYVLHPYKQVKDHKTGVKITKVENFLKGDIDLLKKKN